MTPSGLRERITEQFSDRADRTDIWHGLDLVVETDSFLNLGYSRWYQPHFLGSSQRRLAAKVGRILESQLRRTAGRSLLDVGCGRGGPAIHLSTEFGFEVTGIDLVPYNVTRARQNARAHDSSARFVVGDATALPLAPDRMTACTAMDALVYVPDRARVVSEIADVLAADGALVVSDLVVRSADDVDRQTLRAFAEAWDMPVPATVREYRGMFEDAGLDLRTVEGITRHSVGRFRKWTTLFLGVLGGPVRPLLVALLRWYGLDPDTIQKQVRRAHDALPDLRHAIFVARN